MLNIKDLKDQALAKKEIAKQKIEAAKRDAVNKKLLKANPVPEYIGLSDPTGDAEADSKNDLDEVQLGFRKRAADESNRFALATDSEYWACICFQTREQKEHFLAALDILKFTDQSTGGRYLDGQEVAKQLGVTLPAANVPYKTSAKVDPTWVGFVK